MMIQEAIQDSFQAVPDSVVADTSSAINELSHEVGQAGRDLVSGNFDAIGSLAQSVADRFVGFFPSLVGALFVFVLLYATYRFIGFLLRRTLIRSRRVDTGLENLLAKTYRIVGFTIISIMVIAQFGVNITALIAGLSVVGIAIGFAAQDTVSNFIAGITILIDNPFKVGHFIEIEEVRGTVIDITLRSTRVRTLNNQIMVLPNSHMINQKLINHTTLGVVRIEIPFSIAYKEHPGEARKVILAAVRDDPRVHPEHPPTVVVSALSDSSIDMVLRIFLNDPSQEVEVQYEYVEKVRETLREANIEIPFPHLQLHIDGAKGLASKQPNVK